MIYVITERGIEDRKGLREKGNKKELCKEDIAKGQHNGSSCMQGRRLQLTMANE